MLAKIFIEPLETLVNGYLNLDTDIEKKLIPLKGKVLYVELKTPALGFYISAVPKRLHFFTEYQHAADAVLSASSPLDLLQVWQSHSEGKTKFSEHVNVLGDTDFVQQFTNFMQSIDVDWEEQMAKVLGDICAHSLGNSIRSIGNYLYEVKDKLQANTTEFLQEEARFIPPYEELNDFMKDVDNLRDDVERAALRFQRLQDNLHKHVKHK